MKHTGFVLGVHPTSRGFGWVLFEGPETPFDWGTVEIGENKNKGAIVRLAKILSQYCPAVLVLEQFEGKPSRRAPRIRRLAAAMIALAKKHGITTAIYSRAAIDAALGGSDAATRDEIAGIVAGKFDALQTRLPKKRNIWESEHPNLSLFSAAACAFAWYAAMS